MCRHCSGCTGFLSLPGSWWFIADCGIKSDITICRTLPCQSQGLWIGSKRSALHECGRYVHFHPQQVSAMVNSLSVTSPQAQVPKPQFLLIAADESFYQGSQTIKCQWLRFGVHGCVDSSATHLISILLWKLQSLCAHREDIWGA